MRKRYPHFPCCTIYRYRFAGGISRREGFYAPPYWFSRRQDRICRLSWKTVNWCMEASSLLFFLSSTILRLMPIEWVEGEDDDEN